MLYDFDVYQGANAGKRKDSELGLAANVVMKLCSTLPEQKNHKVFADNFFTGIPLLQKLYESGIHYVGTVRANRLPNCDLQDEKVLQKKGRGAYDWRVEQQSNIVAVRWYDARAVTLLSTYVGPEPVDKVRRWDKSKKEFVEVQRPLIVSEYNLSMNTTSPWVAWICWIHSWQNTDIQ